MCRIISYLGKKSILINDILEKPNSSLVEQSHAIKEGSRGINADGFGMAWYGNTLNDEPGIFKSTQPAWNDNNLKHISKGIEASCLLAHIRSSTVGDVTFNNCHPFSYKEYSLVHNGTIRNFEKVKRPLIEKLNDKLFFNIKGETDSEHLFFLIMQHLYYGTKNTLESAIKEAFDWIVNLQAQHDDESFSKINIFITNGKEMIATRFASKNQEALPLSYSINNSELITNMDNDLRENNSVIIATEPFGDLQSAWIKVPANHFLIVNPETLNVKIKPL